MQRQQQRRRGLLGIALRPGDGRARRDLGDQRAQGQAPGRIAEVAQNVPDEGLDDVAEAHGQQAVAGRLVVARHPLLVHDPAGAVAIAPRGRRGHRGPHLHVGQAGLAVHQVGDDTRFEVELCVVAEVLVLAAAAGAALAGHVVAGWHRTAISAVLAEIDARRRHASLRRRQHGDGTRLSEGLFLHSQLGTHRLARHAALHEDDAPFLARHHAPTVPAALQDQLNGLPRVLPLTRRAPVLALRDRIIHAGHGTTAISHQSSAVSFWPTPDD